jgi:hypothetical protein
MTPREYMLSRLQLMSEGGVLVGTPEENLELHERAQEDLAKSRSWRSQSSGEVKP